MYRLYLDHNLIIYLSEGTITLPISDEYTWVYSDEHFGEVKRSGKENLLQFLNDIKARRIKLILDSKNRITDECHLEIFEDVSKKYGEFVSSIRDFSDPQLDFTPLLSFFAGNKDAINIEKVAEDFANGIDKLIGDDLKQACSEEQRKEIVRIVSLTGQELQIKLGEISKDLKPIEELRDSLAGSYLSNLNPAEGLIIDQIYTKIKKKYPEISMEQLFGGNQYWQLGYGGEMPLYQKIIQYYIALNFIGYWPDKKISKVKKTYGIVSDASHIGHAAFCHALLSEDLRLCKKAEAIYNYLNITTQIFHLQVT